MVGLVWLGAAFYDPRFFYGLAGWDLLVLIAWAIDLVTLPGPQNLNVTRRWTSAAALSVPAKIELVLENSSRVPVFAALIDNVPPYLRPEAPELQVKCRARDEAMVSYQITPMRRGDVELGSVYVRYQTPMRIAERGLRRAFDKRFVCIPISKRRDSNRFT